LALGWCWLAMGSLAVAQDASPGTATGMYTQAARDNDAKLRQYIWSMHVQYTVEGNPRTPRDYLMRYDIDGKLQKSPKTVYKQEKYYGLHGKNKKKEIAEWEQLTAGLGDLVKSYMVLSPTTAADFFSRAQLAPQPDGAVKVSASNVV